MTTAPGRPPPRRQASAARARRHAAHASVTPIIHAVWPGRPYPLGATWDGEGVNFALFQSTPSASSCASSTEAVAASCSASTLRERTGRRLALLSAGSAARACSTAIASTAPTSPKKATASTRTSCCSILTRSRSSGPLRWSDAMFGYTRRAAGARICPSTAATAQPACRNAAVIDSAFTWGDDRAPRDAVERHRHLRAARARLHAAASRGAASRCAAPTRASPPRRSSTTCNGSASPPSSCCPCTPSSTTAAWSSSACATTGATTASASSRRTMRYSASGTLDEFKTMVKTLHAAGIEVILDVVYNHTAEGNHLGPTLSLSRHRQPGLLPPRRGSALLRRLHRHRQHARLLHPRVLQLIFDSLRYWVTEMHVDGFRFDLASTLAREQHDVRLLRRVPRHRPPGSGALAGQAHRRAVGPRRGRLPGRQLPARLGGMERHATATPCARSGRATAVSSASSRSRLTGSSDLFGWSGRAPHASINFITAHDGFTLRDLVSLQRQAQRGQRRRQPRRRIAQPHLELRRRGPDRRSRDQRAAPAPEAQLPRHAASSRRACRCCVAGDELGRTQGGNNNAYCQDNELIVARTGSSTATRRRCGLHRARDRAAQQASAVPPPHVSSAGAPCMSPKPRTSSGSIPTATR